MKIDVIQLEKWVRMNKTPFWNICPSGKNKPLFTYNETEGNIENSIKALYDAIECLPTGEYDFNGKVSATANRGTMSVTFIVGGSQNLSPQILTQNNSNMSSLESMYEKRLADAILMKEKDFEILEHKRLLKEVDEKFNKLYKAMQLFEDDVNTRFDEMDGENASKNGMGSVLKDGIVNVVQHGGKTVIDRFSRNI